MLLAQWFALAGAAFVLTLIWLVVAPEERVYVTGGLSFLAWSAATLTAPGVQVISEGQRLAAGSSALALVSLVFAAVSALAVLGYRTGHYPPKPADDPPFPTDDP